MSLQHAAKYLANQGRGKDTMLVHMTPREVGSLQALAKANGGSLSVNPDTGLPEAGFLGSILPMVIGGGLMAVSGGAINPMTAGMIVGGLQAARTGSLTKGLTAGLGAYGGAGLGASLAGAGSSSLAAQSAGIQFDPTTMATSGQGATVGNIPDVMSIEQMQAAQSGSPFQEATLAELDKAQQANNAMRTAALEQQAAADILKPQVYTAPESSYMDKIKAGIGATTDNLSSAGSFLKDNYKSALAAASPIISEMGEVKAPTTASSGPNPYRYRFERGEANPFPESSRVGVERSYFPNARYIPYAGGGAVEAMSDANALGANTGFPMADIQRGAYATPYQQPISQNVVTGASDTRVDPYTGTERLAEGGATESNPLLDSPYGVARQPQQRQDAGGGPNSAPSENTGSPTGSIAGDIGFALSGMPGFAGAIASSLMDSFSSISPTSINAINGMDAQSDAATAAGLGNAATVSDAATTASAISDALGGFAASEGDSSASASDGVSGGDGGGDGGEADGGLLRQRYAMGGLSDLGGYSDGGRLLRGPGDGVSDSIPAVIGQRQPARLADGEFVVPARIVSELGNGSTEAGARKLYAMMDRVQKARSKTVGKGKIAKNTRADKHLPA